ncbi:MerR family transcriptional regulator [Carnobacterium sp.]|uniref:MerR family transcriptional regulator n=1 Tax=Carnobacterium sp. TaxID=48221 RepID=UPI0028B22F55|nr:MerR family transcriptional regulator [Carnobacterium sp.]
MEYTVNQLSKLAGISGRTLRYYDQIGLLKPKRVSSSSYRIYGTEEVGLLQQILFYRKLEMPLEEIKKIILAADFDQEKALLLHQQRLEMKKAQLDTLLVTIEKTLADKRGERQMTDNEKFEGFKQRLIDENETTYGQEIRESYGKKVVDHSNQKVAGMSEAQFAEWQELDKELQQELTAAMVKGDASSDATRHVAELHKKWLSFTWPDYSPEAHRNLVDMYVSDERFTAYYDERAGKGAAAFLREAIYQFTKN